MRAPAISVFRHSARILTVALLTLTSARAAFQGLGFLSDARFSDASAISADGSTVVGSSATVGTDDEIFLSSFRWTAAEGMIALPKTGSDVPASYATALSADGSVIVGLEVQAGGASTQAFIWKDGVIQSIPYLTPTNYGIASSVSADGTVAVGAGPDAFRWTEVGGTVALPLQLGETSTEATGISADGSVIAGSYWDDNDDRHSFRWTAGGAQSLVIADAAQSRASGISADGSTITGVYLSQATNADVAFVWKEAGVVFLSALSLEEGVITEAYALSADGSLAVGESGNRAAVWDTATGNVFDLQQLLIAAGYTGLENWTLTAANGISADGLSIVGSGINPDGDSEAWIVRLDTVPEPSAAALLALAASGLTFRRRRL